MRIATTVRWGIPIALAVAGLVCLAVGGETATAFGILGLGSALVLSLWNLLLPLSFSSEEDRAEEERARDHFSRYGRWPRERP